MKEKVLAHIGSLVGGLVHNLNTPLMWIMGRAQLLQSRNEKFDSFRDIPDDQFATLKEKNDKDLHSIQEGADKIDHILKALGYKIQMVSEGHTSIELREYLDMELNFLMADMRFKHETRRDVKLPQVLLRQDRLLRPFVRLHGHHRRDHQHDPQGQVAHHRP